MMGVGEKKNERTPLLLARRGDGSAANDNDEWSGSFSVRTSAGVLALIFTAGVAIASRQTSTSIGVSGDAGSILSSALGRLVSNRGKQIHYGHNDNDGDEEEKVRRILRNLDGRLEGSVLVGMDARAHASKNVWNRLVDFQDPPGPLAVVSCLSAADVSVAVPVLRGLEARHGVPFRILSGGHSYAGWSGVLPRGILLSITALDDFSIDLSTDTPAAKLGAAVPAWDLLRKAVAPHGYGSVVGCSPNVTMGGYTLGGGIGRMARKHGLGIDQVLSYEIVLADGRVVTASALENSDLFWALRGGGQSSYGVVTSLTYRLHPMQDALVVAMLAELPAEVSAGAFLSALAAAEPNMPGEAYCEVGNDGDSLYVTFYWFGTGEESLLKGEEYLKETLLPQLFTDDVASSFDVHRKSWRELTLEDYADDGFLVDNWQGFIMKDGSSVDHLEDVLNNMWGTYQDKCEYLVFQFESWGGAIREKAAPTETAFYWRDAIYSLSVLVMVPESLCDAEALFHHCVVAAGDLWNKHISKYIKGSYVNYPTSALSDNPHFASIIWGENAARLSTIKELYDPDNVFHQPQSVPLP